MNKLSSSSKEKPGVSIDVQAFVGALNRAGVNPLPKLDGEDAIQFLGQEVSFQGKPYTGGILGHPGPISKIFEMAYCTGQERLKKNRALMWLSHMTRGASERASWYKYLLAFVQIKTEGTDEWQAVRVGLDALLELFNAELELSRAKKAEQEGIIEKNHGQVRSVFGKTSA